ncbi:imidazolonepropionase-like amidohydrolase [Lacinutrix venerupis]|uniref:amidohydrolase family protein n=1 Tax=Lacinutrix venerupis TaxID=1486034 RepID=UPI000EAE97A5|nr:amidohydrolase family protein [Lacinutrix venerupis]RLJ64456.1 imidazolonepropionase-like amidohydrolase [Lacinutrix venerupis]
MIKNYLLFIFTVCFLSLSAQENIPKNDGVKTLNTNYTVLTNAKIYVSPTQVIEKGTLVIKDGKIVSVGNGVSIPKNAVITDLSGKSIYPSFIDLYSTFGVEKPKGPDNNSRRPQYDATREGYYWNDHIRAEQNAIDLFKYDTAEAKKLLQAGFGVVNTHIDDGIIRGTGTLIALNSNGTNANRILKEQSAQYLGTQKSKTSKQAYPTSIMGAFALLRQVYMDAKWYDTGAAKETDRTLEAFNRNKNQVQIIEAGSKMNALRLDNIGDQFNTQYVFVGGGDEYEYVKEIKATNGTFILPINFPDAYDMENPFLAQSVELSDLREWNQKPYNLKILADNNVPFALSTYKLKEAKEFMPNLLKAIEAGLSKEKALAALTTIPAKIIGKSNEIGTLKTGAYANFLVTSGDIFDKKTTIYQNWVTGVKNELKTIDTKDIRGKYTFNLKNTDYELTIKGELEKLKSEVKTNDKKLGSKISFNDDWLNLTFSTTDTTKQEFIRLVANIKDTSVLNGKAIFPNGNDTVFVATKKTDSKSQDKKEKEDDKNDNEPKVDKFYPVTYPNMAYGFENLPKQETLLFKNVTVWTNEEEGILKNTDVLIKDGKISKIGQNLNISNAKIIDGKGKHLTAGIIDEHTHIATSSVNEAGHNSTAEVTQEDVINPEDINIYYNLSGGVTSAQVLHGSANPIGGRSAIIKMKWGETANNLIYKNSPKFIKFALGENVKQSNWGSNNTVRFPQTRMGVEQVYTDYFQRAKEYDAKKKSGQPYRKDVEMEVIAEILNKERFISCHSYVQSEINMLMKVAEKFNFNINTFTHILEGYKVADKMKAHGVGGSTFSDWWAYKYEVNDAIPTNAAIMHNAGVTVAINSDDGEMSRRLNQEAAKSVKYGDISEEDAWKFVTLNPAKLLHIDDRVGSIKVGKDADVVLWSDHPLSIYAKAEKTIIEGVTYFDIDRDKQLREAIKKEKNELTNLMLQAKNKGLKTKPIEKKEKEHFHCDTNF